MISHRQIASGAIAIFLIGYPLTLRAEELLNVETWPNDVPCNVLKNIRTAPTRSPSGGPGFQTHAPDTKYRNTRETSYWDQKCKGKTL